MNRTMTSAWFLASTAACCGLAAAFTTWVTSDSSGGVRALTALIGIGAALAVMLLVAWAAAAEDVPAPQQEAEAPIPAAAAPTEPAPPSDGARDALAERLSEGLVLRDAIEPAAADSRVADWIDRVGDELGRHRPGLAGYFNALSRRDYDDDGARLDAHLERLDTIVRDLL